MSEIKAENKSLKLLNGFLLTLVLPLLIYCFYILFAEKTNYSFIFLIITSICLGLFLQIQLPRSKIHISFTEAVIFFALLTFNIEAAVILSAVDTLFSMFYMRKKGVNLKNATIIQNLAIAVTSTSITGFAVYKVFPYELTNHSFENTNVLVGILCLFTLIQFLLTSVFISAISSLKTGAKIWRIWFENCINALILFAVNAVVAGLMLKAVERFDALLVVSTLAIAAIAYFTYRRYVNDVKDTVAQVEIAERARAEQAENHVTELQHYIKELEESTVALQKSEKKLRYTAFHDTLTDLPNRNKFLEHLQNLIEKSKIDRDLKFAVIHLNVNRFKTINDSLGHSTGNLLLQSIAKRLFDLIGIDDLAARLGSDEFAVIFDKLSNLDEAVLFAKKISQKLSEPYTLDNRQVFTSVSIGIALTSTHYDNAENLLRDANIAMFDAKDKDKPFSLFDQNMHIQAVNKLQIETDLRYAIKNREFVVYYQPIIDLEKLELIGFEALMRWNHPQKGMIMPSDFIPVSETTGLIVPMTLWILRESCENIVKWQNKYNLNKDLLISVNLSGKHFASPDLVQQIQKIVEETGINVKYLKMEITESAVMENAETAIQMLKQIRELGVQLSIDDFGTGYSSLSYLHRFPINTLKVDRSFVRTMEAATENGEIVRTIIALAKSLKLNVIAEGIESIHQLHQLRILGCEYGQGYLFSRPVPVNEAEKILTDTGRWKAILPKQNQDRNEMENDFSALELDDRLSDTHEIIQ